MSDQYSEDRIEAGTVPIVPADERKVVRNNMVRNDMHLKT
jgi:hypothetical protein